MHSLSLARLPLRYSTVAVVWRNAPIFFFLSFPLRIRCGRMNDEINVAQTKRTWRRPSKIEECGVVLIILTM